jgi:hypothetical protein
VPAITLDIGGEDGDQSAFQSRRFQARLPSKSASNMATHRVFALKRRKRLLRFRPNPRKLRKRAA